MSGEVQDARAVAQAGLQLQKASGSGAHRARTRKGKNRKPKGDSPTLQQRLAAQTKVVQQRYGEAAQARTMLRTIGNREPQDLQELRNLIWLAIRGEEYLEMNLEIKGSIDLAEQVLDLAKQCD